MNRAHAVGEGASSDPAVHTCSNGRVAGLYSRDGYTIVWAHGEIDVGTAPDLMQELAGAVSAHNAESSSTSLR